MTKKHSSHVLNVLTVVLIVSVAQNGLAMLNEEVVDLFTECDESKLGDTITVCVEDKGRIPLTKSCWKSTMKCIKDKSKSGGFHYWAPDQQELWSSRSCRNKGCSVLDDPSMASVSKPSTGQSLAKTKVASLVLLGALGIYGAFRLLEWISEQDEEIEFRKMSEAQLLRRYGHKFKGYDLREGVVKKLLKLPRCDVGTIFNFLDDCQKDGAIPPENVKAVLYDAAQNGLTESEDESSSSSVSTCPEQDERT